MEHVLHGIPQQKNILYFSGCGLKAYLANTLSLNPS